MTDLDVHMLARAVARLPRQQRAIFLAISRDGCSYAEIAERTGCTISEVEQLLADALARLDRDRDETARGTPPGAIRLRLRTCGSAIRRAVRLRRNPS